MSWTEVQTCCVPLVNIFYSLPLRLEIHLPNFLRLLSQKRWHRKLNFPSKWKTQFTGGNSALSTGKHRQRPLQTKSECIGGNSVNIWKVSKFSRPLQGNLTKAKLNIDPSCRCRWIGENHPENFSRNSLQIFQLDLEIKTACVKFCLLNFPIWKSETLPERPA